MNNQKLKYAENAFFERYPGGFNHPELQGLAKKHKMDQMIVLAQESFSKTRFKDERVIAEDMTKVISRSSMVSMFEKPKFRDMVAAASPVQIAELSFGLKAFLHGNQQQGFESLVQVLKPFKLAKWSLITIIPNYYFPDAHVFIKPTTVKGIIDYFELEGLRYKPQPSWDFYEQYKDEFLRMRALVHPFLAPNNAAFSGFLMMSMNSWQG